MTIITTQNTITIQDEFHRIAEKIPDFDITLIAAIEAGRIDGIEYGDEELMTGCGYGIPSCCDAEQALALKERVSIALYGYITLTPMEHLIIDVQAGDTHLTNNALATLYTELQAYRASLPTIYSTQATPKEEEETTHAK